MQPFDFETTTTSSAAIQTHLRAAQKSSSSQTHSERDAVRYLAGGTTLVDLMKLHVEKPQNVVDISSLPLQKIVDTGPTIHIGALVTNSEMAHNALVKKHAPVVSKALLSGASVQLRNLATTGGNLLQRTRCPYFRDTSCACNKREPGSGCSALKGFNRTHSILGGSASCIATHPSDMCVGLAVVDTKILIQGPQGERTSSFAEFYKVPGSTPDVENSLRPHELITGIEIPKTPWFQSSTYVKVRDRASYAFALVSAAVALDLEKNQSGRRIREARVAFGGVGTIPWRSQEAENALRGKKFDLATFKSAAEAAFEKAIPQSQNAFKIKLAEQTLIQALMELGGLT